MVKDTSDKTKEIEEMLLSIKDDPTTLGNVACYGVGLIDGKLKMLDRICQLVQVVWVGTHDPIVLAILEPLQKQLTNELSKERGSDIWFMRTYAPKAFDLLDPIWKIGDPTTWRQE